MKPANGERSPQAPETNTPSKKTKLLAGSIAVTSLFGLSAGVDKAVNHLQGEPTPVTHEITVDYDANEIQIGEMPAIQVREGTDLNELQDRLTDDGPLETIPTSEQLGDS